MTNYIERFATTLELRQVTADRLSQPLFHGILDHILLFKH